MATPRQKTALVGKLAMFMLEEGKIFTQHEYRSLRAQAPISFVQLKRCFGNWARCLDYLRQTQPDLWEELQNMGQEAAIDLSALEDDNDETSTEG